MDYTQNDNLTNRLFSPGDTIILDYTGTPKEIRLIKGTYILECWGAQGGGTTGGFGGYSKAVLNITKNRIYYCHVGQQPNNDVGGWPGAGKSNNTSYYGGGGLSYISQYKYIRPTEVVPVGTIFNSTIIETKDNLIGISSSTYASLNLILYAANHSISCTQFYILVNGIAISNFTVTGAITKVENYFGKSNELEDTPTTISFSTNIGDQIELRTVMSSDHSPKIINIKLTGLNGISSHTGETFSDDTLPILVAGGGGGGGGESIIAGNPSGNNTLPSIENNKFLGKDSDYGGGGSGYYGGNIGTSSLGAGGGSNYGNSIIFNYFDENGINSENGQIRITVTDIPLMTYLISENNKVKYISDNILLDTGIMVNDLIDSTLFIQNGVNKLELETPYITDNTLSLLICTKATELNYKFINTNQIIYTKEYIEVRNYGKIIKIEMKNKLNNGNIKYIFYINDNWYWFQNNNWEITSLNDIDTNIGNTASQINSFTATDWNSFNALFIYKTELKQQCFKIGVILIHNDFSEQPIIITDEAIVQPSSQLQEIPNSKYTITNYYDKFEIKWENINKAELKIFYEGG